MTTPPTDDSSWLVLAEKEAEVERLEFVLKEERLTINALSNLVTRMAYALEADDRMLPERLWRTDLIREAREAVEG